MLNDVKEFFRLLFQPGAPIATSCATINLQERHEEIAFVALTVHLVDGKTRHEHIFYTNMAIARYQGMRSLRRKIEHMGCHCSSGSAMGSG